MADRIMRGWLHPLAIVLGIGVPAALTMGTLRTGAKFEVVATPKQVVQDFEQAIAGKGKFAAESYAAPGVLTHKSATEAGLDGFIQAAKADEARSRQLADRQISAAANIVMVQSSDAGTDQGKAPVVQIYRVYGGKIVEYWTAAATPR